MKIKHIFHSGFHIEYENKILLFDVYNYLEEYKGKDIICFVTHSHSDHYNQDVLKLREHNRVQYVFSTDIPVDEMADVYKVVPGDQLVVDDFEVRVFGTTDLGVSYWVKLGDTTVFHAGDLNWWHWSNDDVATQEHERKIFQDEVAKIQGTSVDFAFVPVDYRLGSYHRLAMDYFIEKLKPRYIIPMHFGSHYESVQSLTTASDTKLLISSKENTYIY